MNTRTIKALIKETRGLSAEVYSLFKLEHSSRIAVVQHQITTRAAVRDDQTTMRIKKVVTDAGRTQSGFSHDRNDCTVRALSVAANIPYERAYSIMAESGRKTGKGACLLLGLLVAEKQEVLRYCFINLPTHKRAFNAFGCVGADGKATTFPRLVGPNIKEFVQQHPTGRYIVRIKGHAVAIVDGAIHDTLKLHAGSIVKTACKIAIRDAANSKYQY